MKALLLLLIASTASVNRGEFAHRWIACSAAAEWSLSKRTGSATSRMRRIDGNFWSTS